MITNYFRILKKPHAPLQTILKTPVKFQKDRTKTVGGVKGTKYLLKTRNHAPRPTENQKQCPSTFLRKGGGQQAMGNTFSEPMRTGVENPPMVPKTSYCRQDSSDPRHIQCFGRQVIENRQSSQNRVGIGSIESEFNFPNVQLSQSGSVRDTLQSKTATLCIPSSGQSSLRDRCIFHGLELSSCLRLSPNNDDSFCPEQDTSISVQNSSDSPSLATTSLVLRGPTTACFRPSLSSSLSKPINSSKRKVSTSKPPSSQLSRLRVIKQSIRDKYFSKNVADFVSKSRRPSTQKVYDAKWIVYIRWCHRRKVNPVSAPLTVTADFLMYLFSEKKYRISTFKGYRSMISNTLKFETGNRIGSNPVLSELTSSFELQRPAQRSLTPKWDLSWLLVCLQRALYEPLHNKASKPRNAEDSFFSPSYCQQKFMPWQWIQST